MLLIYINNLLTTRITPQYRIVPILATIIIILTIVLILYSQVYLTQDLELSIFTLVWLRFKFTVNGHSKIDILSENEGKSGIYRWVHNLTGDSYVGSAVNIKRRLYQYYNVPYITSILAKSISHIYRALLKYGYSSFTLEIIEYCDPDKLMEREQYYLDTLNPTYNILPTAGSTRGHRHTEESKAKIRDACLGNSKCLGRKLTEETKAKIGAAHIGIVPGNAVKVSVSDVQGSSLELFYFYGTV